VKTRTVTVAIDDADHMTIEIVDIDESGDETPVATSRSKQPGVWAAVAKDEDLWNWVESRSLVPKCEHSVSGVYRQVRGRETFMVSGPVLRSHGRRYEGRAINVRLPEGLLANLEAEAKREGISRAEAIRRLLGDATGT
jgi:hypothetical protein